ncbi:MAG: vanadium-dependent haloperoxidase, partial [Myxococcota bacterium]
GAPYFDAAPGPDLDDDATPDDAVDLVRLSALLDPDLPETIDLSPGVYGNNSLGTDDGSGHGDNPITGEAYAPNVVSLADFGRVIAEIWADGPRSETPPGHWNAIANEVADHPLFEARLFGEGEVIDRAAWDVHVYLALNGALHDAAIAAWEAKRQYESARPITLIRYMGERGQRSDPDLPSYDPAGLPLVPGLIELINEASTAPGERHAHLAPYRGQIALRSWRGEPGDRDNEVSGVGWIRAVEWLPYQRRTFVSPAFPGYVSGHSTFSRAAAEVLTAMTGSAFYPGGLGELVIEPDYLVFEGGPAEGFTLTFATYYDAADQAGQSRLWGGIHIVPDDYVGRRIGSEVGLTAVAHARRFFDGSAR